MSTGNPPSVGASAARFAARLDARYRAGAPVRRDFVRARSETESSPLSVILNGRSGSGGGRGGGLRLAVLITLLWVCAAPPYTSQRPARAWAELLGLDDPATMGARRVLNSLSELEHRRFLTLTYERDGRPPIITLLRETGSGAAYTHPYVDRDYFRVPQQLWTNGMIKNLTGAGLAMYLIVLSHHNGTRPEEGIWFTKDSFRALHTLGESTRLKGLRELVDNNILSYQDVSIDDTGSTTYRTFTRRLYVVEAPYTPPPSRGVPAPPATLSFDEFLAGGSYDL